MLKQWATPINRRQSNATAINFDGIAVGRGWWERERERERERGGGGEVEPVRWSHVAVMKDSMKRRVIISDGFENANEMMGFASCTGNVLRVGKSEKRQTRQ